MSATPFVIDLPPDARGDVELALRSGLTVVSFDCKTLELLPACKVDGQYSYAGYTLREEVMSLKNADEARVNLPLGAVGLEGKIGAEFERGATLDVALAMVGRETGSKHQVLRDELQGDCSRATHFVRAATLGAFAMGTQTMGRTSSAAQLFGVGAEGEGEQSVRTLTRDGSLEACRTAAPGAEAPKDQCGAPLRLRLEPFVTGELPPTAGSDVAAAHDDGVTALCPSPLVSDDLGKCVTTERPHICRYEDVADCESQCAAGSMGSCAILGRSYQLGRGVPRDGKKAADLLLRSCEASVYPACGRIGEMLVTEERTKDAGVDLLGRACSGGWAPACTMLAEHAKKTSETKVNVVELFDQGCRAGDAEGCWSLGVLFAEGLGVNKNLGDAAAYLKRGCDGGAQLGCSAYAKAVAEGYAGAPNPEMAATILARSCKLGFAASCNDLSKMHFLGVGVPRDTKRGVALLDRACEGRDFGACFVLGMRYQAGVDVERDSQKAKGYMTRACEAGVTTACEAVLGKAGGTTKTQEP